MALSEVMSAVSVHMVCSANLRRLFPMPALSLQHVSFLLLSKSIYSAMLIYSAVLIYPAMLIYSVAPGSCHGTLAYCNPAVYKT
jgi:hypothetical protein